MAQKIRNQQSHAPALPAQQSNASAQRATGFSSEIDAEPRSRDRRNSGSYFECVEDTRLCAIEAEKPKSRKAN